MVKPNLEQIESYMSERDFKEEDQAEAFFDYFESNGWQVGKAKMKNWQAAVRTWIRNAKKWGKPSGQTNQPTYQSQADRIRQQADQARADLKRLERGVYADNVRAFRSAG